jgi:predicted  nucleic acid-binding Zn-ribbon protein
MSVSSKLEADSAKLRRLEDAINERLAHVRGKLEGLRTAEEALIAAMSQIEARVHKEEARCPTSISTPKAQ